ncbi:MAG: TonB-dependent receptor plug domain-containing protein [Verrucomicrobia bacterium]|nr:TonB-dependent receptor plug domain-containing protein [Verrucomicrobiota bacterium]
MKTNRMLIRIFAALAAVTSVFAQSVSRPASPAPAKEDSIIRLSPFEVTSNNDVGYQAVDTMAGSRLNTSLKDVAASISVFTEEFIKDINATDLKEVLAFGNNFQPDLDDAGSFGDASSGNSVMGTAVGSNRVRGLPVDIARNYFKWFNATDTYNVGRVEDARGPNSVLFGIGNAGGIINVATKQAMLKRNTRELALSGGSYGSWRATLDANQPLGDKAAVRFNAVVNNTRYFQPYRYSESRRAHLAAKYEVTSWLTTRFEYEKGEVEANSGRLTGIFDSMSRWHNAGRPLFSSTAPNTAFAGLGSRLTSGNLSTLRYVSNSNQLIHMGGQIATVGVGGIGVGYPLMDRKLISFSVNSGGPGQVRTNPYSSLSGIVTAQLGRKTFVEIGVNRQDRRFTSMDPVFSHQLYADPNTTLPGTLGVNPYAGRLYMETYWRKWDSASRTDSARLSISHEVDAGKWGRYRGGVFGEFEKQDPGSWPSWESFDGRPFNNSPENNFVYRRTYVTEGAWGSYYVNSPSETGLLRNVTDPISGRTFSSSWVVYNQEGFDPTKGSNAMGMLQGYWFNGRLVAGTGYRKDRFDVEDHAQERDPVTNVLRSSATTVVRSISQPQTRTFSAVWHALPNVSFKYNQANNSSTINSGVRIYGSVAGKPVSGPASKGTGKDYGVTLSLLQGKLHASLVRYSTSSIGELFSGAGTHNTAQDRILVALLNNNQITRAELDARYTTATGTSRDKSADGYEASLTASPGNWRLSANFSYTDGVYSTIIPDVVTWWAEQKAFYLKYPQDIQTGVGAETIGTTIAAEDDNIAEVRSGEGIGLVGNSKYKANFFARYSFKQGFLKGAFVGGGYTYAGKMLVGQTLVTKELQYAPPVGQASLLLGYERRVTDRMRLSTQLNVSNLFDETDPRIIRYNNNAALGPFSLVKRIAVRDPRVWTLSSRLSF